MLWGSFRKLAVLFDERHKRQIENCSSRNHEKPDVGVILRKVTKNAWNEASSFRFLRGSIWYCDLPPLRPFNQMLNMHNLGHARRLGVHLSNWWAAEVAAGRGGASCATVTEGRSSALTIADVRTRRKIEHGFGGVALNNHVIRWLLEATEEVVKYLLRAADRCSRSCWSH